MAGKISVMKIHLLVLSRLRFAFEKFSNFLARHWKRSFYLYLAALFTEFRRGNPDFDRVVTEREMADYDLSNILRGQAPRRAAFQGELRFTDAQGVLFFPVIDLDLPAVEVDLQERFGRTGRIGG